jgi:phenylpropionate dioxygenase-like ring-hydroxylating dioxygenase large terminal subunit
MYPLSDGAFAARNQWYIAAWSQDISREPMERWILNEPVAFYRKEDGTAVAVAGRCPHDNIECGYHGITFGPDGNCVKIPTQDAIPNVCRIAAYPLVETWKWVWIWMGDPALADPALIPDHDAIKINDPDFQVDGNVYHPVPGRYMLMHDNLLDLSHVAALHKTTIASDGLPEAVEASETGDNWLESTRHLKEVGCPPFFSALFGYNGRVDRTLVLRAHLPCLHAGYDRFVKAESAGESAGEELGTVWVYHAITPATEHTAHYFFAMGRNFAQSDEGFGTVMMDAIGVTLEEDMLATREVERMLDALGQTPQEILIKSDAHCVKGRRMFDKMIRAEQSGEGNILEAAE